MVTWVVLLRGVNVGGKNKVKMAELKQTLEASGLSNVRTYIQSGNLVFDSAENAAAIQTSVSSMLKEGWGLEVPVVAIKAAELRKIEKANPFDKLNTDFQYVTLLDKKPSAADAKAIGKLQFPDEQFEVVGRCVYLYCPNGAAKSKLTVPLFEKQLKVVGTNRNWRTLVKLIELSAS